MYFSIFRNLTCSFLSHHSKIKLPLTIDTYTLLEGICKLHHKDFHRFRYWLPMCKLLFLHKSTSSFSNCCQQYTGCLSCSYFADILFFLICHTLHMLFLFSFQVDKILFSLLLGKRFLGKTELRVC